MVNFTSNNLTGLTEELSLELKQLIQNNLNTVTDAVKNDIMSNFVNIYKVRINQYINDFEKAVNTWRTVNHVKRITKQILDPYNNDNNSSQDLSKVLTAKAFQNNKRATQHLCAVLQQGHNLLLEIRAAITGQQINTKMLISVKGKTYLVNEVDLQDINLVLSRGMRGESTVSNPFSLAYKIDNTIEQSLQDLVQEDKAEEISSNDIYNIIWQRKIDYLNKYYRDRKLEPIWNSKDAEIYMMYVGSPEGGGRDISELTVEKYHFWRKNLGGGGGYHSAFFKIGDVGLTQVKYFKITNKGTTVNFARFSLIRNNIFKLQSIFNLTTKEEIGQNLLALFTERTTRLSDTRTRLYNEAAKAVIQELFKI